MTDPKIDLGVITPIVQLKPEGMAVKYDEPELPAWNPCTEQFNEWFDNLNIPSILKNRYRDLLRSAYGAGVLAHHRESL